MSEGNGHGASAEETLRCKVCVVGAGMGGLSALFAASRHLGSDDLAVLVDRRDGPGGMWNDTYRYVRLHQPHPFFTAGNIAWQIDQPRDYLATRTEVVDHMRHCLHVLQGQMKLQTRFGFVYLRHTEPETGPVRVECQSADGGRRLTIEADLLVHASGWDVEQNPPLPLSSDAVHSTSPDAADFEDVLRRSEGPFYLAGGGKTAMDTAHMLLRSFPERPLRMYIGAGTMFLCRDDVFPTGARRIFGKTIADVMVDVAGRFDGDNEVAVMDRARSAHMLALSSQCRHHRLGLLSRAELRFISDGADEVNMGYVQDVVDQGEGLALTLRSGASRRVEPGSTFINVTGYISPEPRPHVPYLSRGGRVLAISTTSLVLPFPAYAGYLLTHQYFLGGLRDLPLYELDITRLRQGALVGPTAFTLMLHNMLLLRAGLPLRVQREFGADSQLWFPLPRRLAMLAKLIRFKRAHPDHLQHSLDRVRERTGVRCGLLRHDGPGTAVAARDTVAAE